METQSNAGPPAVGNSFPAPTSCTLARRELGGRDKRPEHQYHTLTTYPTRSARVTAQACAGGRRKSNSEPAKLLEFKNAQVES